MPDIIVKFLPGKIHLISSKSNEAGTIINLPILQTKTLHTERLSKLPKYSQVVRNQDLNLDHSAPKLGSSLAH